MTDPSAQTARALAGRYTIERELGGGGMATVYLALDVKLQRRVALKVLRPELAASLGNGRFLREIAIAARLSHPHILPLHDSGEAGGQLYYAMPYVEESLRQRLERSGAKPAARMYYEQFLRRYDQPMPSQAHLVQDARTALARLQQDQ